MKRLSHVVILMAALVGGTLANAAPLPVEDFFSYPKVSSVQISPDGKYLAMSVADDKTGEDRKTVAVFDLNKHKVTATFSTVGDQVVQRIWWVNNSRILVSTATQTGSLDSPVPDGKLYAINVDGTQERQLMGMVPGGVDSFTHLSASHDRLYFNDVLYIPPDDAKEITVSVYVGANQPNEAYDLDVYEGKTRLVTQSPTANGALITDNTGVARLATGSNLLTGVGKIFYRDSGKDLDWKNISSLLNNDDPAESALTPVGFAGDDKDFYWLGRSATSTLALDEIDPDTMHIKTLFSDPEFDVMGLTWSFDWQKTSEIVAVATMPGLPAIHIIDPDSLKAQYLASLYQAFPGQIVSITSNTRDKKLMVVRVRSDRNPGAYYLFDASTSKVSLLFNVLPSIDPSQMATMKPVVIKARDGVVLHGYLTTPAGVPAHDLPLILNPHGGPHGIRDEWGWNPEVQFLANHGYAVLQVNYRGSGGYGMKFQDMGYRHWGTTMQDDLADAVNWTIKQGIADPKRICIYGASYGGYAALENAIRYPELYSCVVGYVGLYDLSLLSEHIGVRSTASGKRYYNVVMGDDDAELRKYSPAYNADKLKAPLFLIYGGADKLVVPENAEEMMSALDKLHKPYEKMYERNEGHGFRKPEHNFELYTKMLAFFQKNIGPGVIKH